MIAVFEVDVPEGTDLHAIAGTFPSDVAYVDGLIVPGYNARQVGELLRRGVLLPGLARPDEGTTMDNEQNVGTDPNEELYVIRAAAGAVTTIGWDTVRDLIERYALNLEIDPPPTTVRGSVEEFDTMANLRDALRRRFEQTGEAAVAELSPQLAGLEGRRVRATRLDGSVISFVVGITDGFLPHHVEIRGLDKRPRADLEYDRVEILDD